MRRKASIEVNQEIAKATGTGKAIVACCPAHVYSENLTGPSRGIRRLLGVRNLPRGRRAGALRWHYPRGGFGVQFREG